MNLTYLTRTDSGQEKTYPWQTRTMEMRVHWSDGTFGTLPAEWTVAYPTRTVKLSACSGLGACQWMPEDLGKTTVTATYQDKTGSLVYDTANVSVPLQPIPAFTDELPSWAKQSIIGMARVGVVKGYDDGRFAPADAVTKGQFAVLVQRAFAVRNGKDEKACPTHTGGPAKDHFAYGAFCLFLRNAWNLQWATDLDAPIMRKDVAMLLYDLSPEDDPGGIRDMTKNFKAQLHADVSAKDEFYWASLYSEFTGLLMGNDENRFLPNNGVNRAEAAQIMRRYLENVLFR